MTFTAKSSSTGFQGYGASITQSHTIAAGSNRILVVGYGAGDTENIASVLFNGTALTRARADFGVGISASSYLYYLLDPPVGTFSLVATLVGSTSVGVCVAQDFVADSPINSISVTAGNRAVNAGPTSLAIAGTGALVVDFIATQGDGGSTAAEWVKNAAQTLVSVISNGQSAAGNCNGAMSYANNVTTMGWAWTTYKAFSQTAMVITQSAVSPTVPNAPTIGTATAGNGTASVPFIAPTSNGGAAITGYTATASTGELATGTSSPIGFATLSNAVARTFTVHATNSVGNSLESASSNSVTPSASADTTVPVMTGAITISAITTSGFRMTWPAASDNIAVTGYEVSTDNGTTYINAGNVLFYDATGKSPATLYNVKVRAYDAAANKAVPLSTTATTATAASGTITTLPLTNNAGTLLVSLAGWNALVYSIVDGSLVATINGLTTSASGTLTITAPTLTAGTTYRVVLVSPTADEGMKKMAAV